MWELDYKESWAQRNSCFWTVVLEKTLVCPLDCKEIKPVNPKGNQSWIFIVRLDAEAETPIFWPPDAKNWLIGKDPDAGKDRRWEEKGKTKNEMAGWHHWLDGHDFEQALGGGDRQGSLACCIPWGCKELNITEWLTWTELNSACRNIFIPVNRIQFNLTTQFGPKNLVHGLLLKRKKKGFQSGLFFIYYKCIYKILHQILLKYTAWTLRN